MKKIDQEFRDKVIKAYEDIVRLPNSKYGNTASRLGAGYLYYRVFDEIPTYDNYIDYKQEKVKIELDKDGRLVRDQSLKTVKNNEYVEYEDDILDYDEVATIDLAATRYNFFKNYSEYFQFLPGGIYIFDHCMLYATEYNVRIFSDSWETVEEIRKIFVFKNSSKPNEMFYVLTSNGRFETFPIDVKQYEDEILDNYNDDLPNDRIKELLSEKEAALIILHGEPGTGKTSYLNYLANTIDKKFYLFDSSLLEYITSAAFMRFLVSKKNSVFVLEDCEDLLRDRISGNKSISTLLGLTDGIISNGLGIKFICTFNADITQIDKALLRDGRLKMMYEFKPLTQEKAEQVAEKLGHHLTKEEIKDGMTLAKLYNYDVDNGNKEMKKKLGF